jgi:enterochelin esterase family protein
VLAQSGSFWWRPSGDPAYEWLARQFAERPRLPLAFYLDVGRREARRRGRPSQLASNRRMRDLLRRKGYTVHYAEHYGQHDYLAWQATLADGLQALVGTAPHLREE